MILAKVPILPRQFLNVVNGLNLKVNTKNQATTHEENNTTIHTTVSK